MNLCHHDPKQCAPMRADRLVRALLFLQANGSTTAAQLAEELEVSVRTARRDLEALGMSGIPIYPQPGRGGGWRLIGGAKTDLTGLTGPEAQAIFLAIGASAASTPALAVGLSKLAQALPQTLRQEAEVASAAVVIDPTQWSRSVIGAPEDASSSEYFAPLQRAIVSGRQIQLGYAGRAKAASVRVVHPLGLVSKGGIWYLVAAPQDFEEGERPRTFRLSRVLSVDQLDLPLRRPANFDLETSWSQTTGAFQDHRNPVETEALAEPWTLNILRHVLGTRLTIGDRQDDGRVQIRATGASSRALAGELGGFGAAVEFLSPATILSDLAHIGRELSDLYGQT